MKPRASQSGQSGRCIPWSTRVGPQADEAPGLPVQRQPDLPDGEGAGRQVVVCTASDADREDTAEADVTARLT